MSAEDALQRLGESTAEACLGVLEMFAAGKVSAGEVTPTKDSAAAFAGRPDARRGHVGPHVDGVTGGNVFLITLDGARKLAASMMGMDEPEDPDADRALRARAERGLGGHEPDDGLRRRRDVGRARHRGRDLHPGDQDVHVGR